MGKFTNSKNVPSFLKQPNYYAKHEKFDDEVEESIEECETCGNEKYMESTNSDDMVKSFARFIMEKKGIDLTGDGKVDTEDWKAARDMAIKGVKAKKKGKAVEIPAPKAKKGAKKEEPVMEPIKGKKPAKKAVKIEESSWHGGVHEGHTCHCGTKMSVSEAAHHLIEAACENIALDAKHYHQHIGSFEDYVGECAAYMEGKLYSMVDDGLSMNEGWTNESSACYESTKHEIDSVCEAICHEALHIHNDETPRLYNNYVDEAIGCYKNGMMECSGYKMYEDAVPVQSEEASQISDNEIAGRIDKALNTNPKFLEMDIADQAAAVGLGRTSEAVNNYVRIASTKLTLE